MSPATLALLAAGAAAGLGAALVVAVIVPERPDLLAALHPTGQPATQPSAEVAGRGRRAALRRWQTTVEKRLAATRLSTPEVDLRTIAMTRGEFLLTRVGLSAAALLIAPAYVLIFSLFGLGIPPTIPAIVGLVLAGVVWLAVGQHIAGKASTARRDMRHALVAYLQLVALHRAAGLGIGAALDSAADASSAWTFRRIAAAISSATRSGHSHWQGLSALAGELGIDELADLSAIAANAAMQGSTVYSTLLARAGSLRTQLQADDTAAAQVASARMAIPKAILSMAMMAFLLYPAISALTAT